MPDKFTITRGRVKEIIKEQVLKASTNPWKQITDEFVQEINEKKEQINNLISDFLENKEGRKLYKEELNMLNESMDEVLAILTDGGKNA